MMPGLFDRELRAENARLRRQLQTAEARVRVLEQSNAIAWQLVRGTPGRDTGGDGPVRRTVTRE